MPEYIRPRRVTVETDGDFSLLIAAILLAGAAISAAAAVITDVLFAVLVCLGVAVAGSLAILAAVLRRNRAVLYVPEPPRAVPDLRAPALGASRPAEVEGARRTALLGIVLSDETEVPR